jgi:hypothetical protein
MNSALFESSREMIVGIVVVAIAILHLLAGIYVLRHRP